MIFRKESPDTHLLFSGVLHIVFTKLGDRFAEDWVARCHYSEIRMGNKNYKDLDALIDEILTDAYGDEEQRWAFLQAFTDNVKIPCAATVAGQSIRLIKFDYDGNDRVGLTAKCRRPDGSRYSIAVSDVVVEDAAAQRYIAAYRRWLGITPYPKKH